ncbi:MAG: PIG-L family deacetylase [Rikenellaceae bacterium]
MSSYKLQNQAGLIPDAEPLDIISRFERIPTTIVDTATDGCELVARSVADLIRKKGAEGKACVLGLASGQTTVGVYRELVRMHKQEGLSFADVVVFTVFEYYPIDPEHNQSYNHILREELLSQVDIKSENIHTLNSEVPSAELPEYCKAYEAEIEAAGGIDLLLLAMGVKGQLALNESGSYPTTRTRAVALSNFSRKIAANAFQGVENVPTRALTIGLATILSANEIAVLSWGEEKAESIVSVVEGDIDLTTPASQLQKHHNVTFVIDQGAASGLTRVHTPWIVGSCQWDPRFVRKAVLWLCQKVQKPILKLTYQDYINNSLGQMIEEVGSTYDMINIQVFNDLQHTISGWPGGKPNADDTTRPVKSSPFPKKVVIFSPHPDDDVISMGGTFLRLVDQGHDVHVAYETSGNIAVHDDVVLQFLDSAAECGLGDQFQQFKEIIANKVKGEPEPELLRKFKGSLRRGEAKAACRHYGLNDKTNVHFLNLPFYETGSVKKGSVGQDDVDIIKALLRDLQPNQIYAAGDLSDPHGTHRVCIEAVLAALTQIIEEGKDEWINSVTMWLYRGAWQEWDLDMVDMAVPLSPDEVIKKRHAIYRHLSQKDIVPFPGEDKREFWQRAEDRTQATAELYNALGMAEYQAIEVFVNYDIFKMDKL